MLSDILESTKQSLLERLSNPLIGSFVISWCLWNWKFLVILFSDATVSQTFLLVSQVSFPNVWACLIQGFVLPLFSAAIYIFVLPYPSQFVYAFTLKRQQETNEVKQKIQNQTLLSIEDSNILRDEFRDYERQSKEKIEELNKEIARLSSPKVATKQTKKTSSISQTQSSQPTELQFEILQFVSQSKDSVLQEKIISALRKPRVKIEFEVGELLKNGFLKDSFNFNGELEVALTHEGRRVLLEKLDNN